ncbi:MAG: MmgE/PrpD family protein [Dehalococcoidia bacterium]|nr:MmgE/PrpD family protein [Dehalococcoidia bacterium]
MDVTGALIGQVEALPLAAPPADVATVARSCLLDWCGCALAGSREPLARILVDAVARGDAGDATLVGLRPRTTNLTAAMINGAASHALDFDDTHTLMSGHPSVPVVPAALALAERDGSGGRDFLAALIAGIETECRLGALVNPGHYIAGFHATGTLGAFGAAAACARLLSLDAPAQARALALAGTQAAGLKSAFGTMAKPLHAGRAAANGLLAALLAHGGFTAADDIIATAQGFAVTHAAPAVALERLARYDGRFLIAETLFKYHASCYLTHAAIDAARSAAAGQAFAPGDIESVEVRGSTACIGVCDIAEPATGLEAKFSVRATTAMALLGDDTSDPAAFNDARMGDAWFRAMLDRVTFVPLDELPGTRARVIVRAGGRVLEADADTGRPAADVGRQWERLGDKFFALASPVIGDGAARALHDAIARVDGLASMREIASLLAAPAQAAAAS